jgi:uncharacterized membrane protein
MLQHLSRIYIFISILFFTGCGDSSEDSSSTELTTTDEINATVDSNSSIEELNNSTELKRVYLSGVAIDGYISGAEVEFIGLKTTTDENGSWRLDVTEKSSTDLLNSVVTIYGGIDQTTGDSFEGVVMGPVHELNQSIISTPITTIISAMMIEDPSISTNEAFENLSYIINIPVATLKRDHLKMIQMGTLQERIDGIKAVKTALIFQKSIEIISEAIGGEQESFVRVLHAVSVEINTICIGCDDNRSYESILSDTTAIADRLELSDDERKRVLATSNATSLLIQQVNTIDENQYTELMGDDEVDFLTKIENETKAADLIAHQAEELVKSNLDNPEDVAQLVESFWDMIAVLGGVNGMGTTFAESNASTEELYGQLFQDEEIVERLKSISLMFKEFDVDNSKISEMIQGLSQIPYDYESDSYSQEAIAMAKSVIESVIGREVTLIELQKIVTEMLSIKQLLNNALGV